MSDAQLVLTGDENMPALPMLAAQARGIELTPNDFFQIPTPQPRRRKP